MIANLPGCDQRAPAHDLPLRASTGNSATGDENLVELKKSELQVPKPHHSDTFNPGYPCTGGS